MAGRLCGLDEAVVQSTGSGVMHNQPHSRSLALPAAFAAFSPYTVLHNPICTRRGEDHDRARTKWFELCSNFGLLIRGANHHSHTNVKGSGYATCIAGKWQLGRPKDSPARFGFERSCLWRIPEKSGRSRRTDRLSTPALLNSNDLIQRPRKGLRRDGEYGPSGLYRLCLAFIEEMKEKPFLVYYPMILDTLPLRIRPPIQSELGISERLRRTSLQRRSKRPATAFSRYGRPTRQGKSVRIVHANWKFQTSATTRNQILYHGRTTSTRQANRGRPWNGTRSVGRQGSIDRQRDASCRLIRPMASRASKTNRDGVRRRNLVDVCWTLICQTLCEVTDGRTAAGLFRATVQGIVPAQKQLPGPRKTRSAI